MTSIRQRLFIWLLIGLSILWAIAGAGVYLAFKQSEIAKLDSELSKLEGNDKISWNNVTTLQRTGKT